jgi:hypothetical protein
MKGYIRGLEYDILKAILQQMNMTLSHAPTPKGFEIEEASKVVNLFNGVIGKEIYIALGVVGKYYLFVSHIDSTNNYYMMTDRWYVPCSEIYSRWSSIFRILSVKLWLVLIISIVFVAISIIFVGRYICTSDRQGHRTLTSF